MPSSRRVAVGTASIVLAAIATVAAAFSPVPPAPVYRVGPGQRFTELHQIPPLTSGVRVEISWRPQPYKSKLAIGVSRVQIVGIPGPNGERPTIDGDGAIEVSWAKYWSSQVSDKGVFTVAPSVAGETVRGVRIDKLRITGARNGKAGFKNAAGKGAEWSTAAAGVAWYRADRPEINECEIFECNNGVFATTDGGGGIVSEPLISWSHFHDCGVPGSFHYHNTYIEALRPVYQFNRYDSPKSGSAGCNLKDRSAGAVIRYNRFEGGARMLDLVDPETGGPQFVNADGWGRDYVYGNVIINKHATTPIHYGYDGQAAYSRKVLYAYYNTCVNVNDQQGGRWRTVWFKTEGLPTINLADNIFHNWSPSGGSPGEMWVLTEEYGTGTKFDIKPNWWTDHTQPVYTSGGPSKAQLVGWSSQIKGSDPKFINIAAGDVNLRPDSPCRRKAMRLGRTGWPVTDYVPSHTFDPPTKNWPARTGLVNLGACEYSPPKPAPVIVPPAPPPAVQPMPDQIRPVASPLRKGGPRPDDSIADALAAWKGEYAGDWWPWGLQAVDVDGDGRPELIVTQHNGGSRVLKETDSGWRWLDVGSNLGGTFRPYVLDANGDGCGDLLFRDSLQNTAFLGTGDGKFVPAGFAYGTGNDPIRVITPTFFGHDWGRWAIPGFAHIPYTNPAYAKLTPNVKAELDANLGKQFFRAWFHTHPDMVVVSGHWSYGKGQSFCRFLLDRRGKLIEATPRWGLPTTGVVVFAQDFNFDGSPDYLVSGAGFYLSGPQGYNRVGGALSDFLSSPSDWPHEVQFSESHLIVSNIKGETVKIFQRVGAGQFALQQTLWGWSGECVCLADIDGNGVDDICVGTGGRNGTTIDIIYR